MKKEKNTSCVHIEWKNTKECPSNARIVYMCVYGTAPGSGVKYTHAHRGFYADKRWYFSDHQPVDYFRDLIVYAWGEITFIEPAPKEMLETAQ